MPQKTFRTNLLMKFFILIFISGTIPLLLLGLIAWMSSQQFLLSPEQIQYYQLLIILAVLLGILLEAIAAWLYSSRMISPLNTVRQHLKSLHINPDSDELSPAKPASGDEMQDFITEINFLADQIKEKNKSALTLQHREERYQLVEQATQDGIWDWDLQNNTMFYSTSWRLMLGYTVETLQNHPEEWFNRIYPEDLDQFKFDLNAHLENKTTYFKNEHRILHQDGTYGWIYVRGLAVRDNHHKALRIAGTITDIDTTKSVQDQLLHEAMHDPVTRLPNRVFFISELQHAIERKKRHADYEAAVLFLDLDRFKIINDSLGHAFGDNMLHEIARRLKITLRTMDTVARFGGDEFAILLEDISGINDAIRVATRIQTDIAKSIHIDGHEVFTTASIGIVMVTSNYENTLDILRDADTAMFLAKKSGRARFEIFDAEMHAHSLNVLRLETELRLGIERKEFIVHYQPIFSLVSGKILSVEALVRWQHPDRGLIYPADFLEVAEDSGLILAINRYVLSKACQDAADWQQSDLPGLEVSVNVSARHLQDPGIVEHVRTALADSGLPNAALHLEITEGLSLYDSPPTIQNLYNLNVLGISISIDDFGTNYSSLGYLKRYPFNIIKIDRTFIKDVPMNQDDAVLASAIVSLGKNLGMQVIGEGVEKKEQLDFLVSKGCDAAQGYLFCKPMPANQFSDFLNSSENNIIKLLNE
jgi:diguanylate cyclase (GGDEF)-like protein/PAS domain S-box-containing protein